MSDAREWLDQEPLSARKMHDALLAVLDECDKIKRTYDRGHPAVYDDFEAGLLTMMDNVVRAINKVLSRTPPSRIATQARRLGCGTVESTSTGPATATSGPTGHPRHVLRNEDAMTDAREWLAEALRTDDYGVLHDDPPQEWFIRANPDGGRRATIDALLAVLDLHEPVKHPMWSESYRDRHDLVKLWDRLVCRYCYDLNYSQYGLDDQPDEYDWPCSTVESINEALGISAACLCGHTKDRHDNESGCIECMCSGYDHE